MLLTAESILSEMVRAEIEISPIRAARPAPRILPVRLRFEGLPFYPINAYLDPVQHTLWTGPADTPRLVASCSMRSAAMPRRWGRRGAAARGQPASAVRGAIAARTVARAGEARSTWTIHGMCRGRPTPWRSITYASRARRSRSRDRANGQELPVDAHREGRHGRRQERRAARLPARGRRQQGRRGSLLSPVFVVGGRAAELFDTVEKFWNSAYASPQNCTRYMEQPLGGPCIFAIDETDAIFQTSFSQDFFSMLRSWHNRRADPIRRCWKKLDIILSTSTEPQFFIDRPHESPFNVGVTLRVEDFTRSRSASSTRVIRALSGGDIERVPARARPPVSHPQGAIHGRRQRPDVLGRRAVRPCP